MNVFESYKAEFTGDGEVECRFISLRIHVLTKLSKVLIWHLKVETARKAIINIFNICLKEMLLRLDWMLI
ncbi:hypothetical protein [Bartonella sp. CB189]|uniref:hypothetical protein n=1 Tax=Bartonella sp. CB189 TaxID=3112254 RepID=UPI002F96E1E6